MKTKNIIFALITIISISLAFSGCVNQEFEVPEPNCDVNLTTTHTIRDLKTIYQGDTMTITEDIIIECYVTSTDHYGNFYKEIVVEDSTDAIALMVDASYMYTKFPVGQKVYIKCKDLLIGDSYGALKLGGTYDEYGVIKFGRIQGDAVIDMHIIPTCDNEPIEPKIATLDQIDDNLIYKLVKFENVQFKEDEIGTTWADGINQEDVNHFIIDENQNTLIVRTSGYANFANDTIPNGNGTITGILTIYNGDYQLLIRNTDDASLTGERFREPIIKDFEDLDIFSGGWTNQIVTGVAWTLGEYGNYAQCTNYDNGNTTTESWYISPSFDFSGYTSPFISFRTAWGYFGAEIEVFYSTDYDGTSLPATATWTDLNPTLYTGSNFWTWTDSGELTLPTEASVYVGFKYTGSSSDGRTWEIDNIVIDDSAK